MGAGIAQVAAVWLDRDDDRLRSGDCRQIEEGIGKRLERQVEKGRLSSDEAIRRFERLVIVQSISNWTAVKY